MKLSIDEIKTKIAEIQGVYSNINEYSESELKEIRSIYIDIYCSNDKLIKVKKAADSHLRHIDAKRRKEVRKKEQDARKDKIRQSVSIFDYNDIKEGNINIDECELYMGSRKCSLLRAVVLEIKKGDKITNIDHHNFYFASENAPRSAFSKGDNNGVYFSSWDYRALKNIRGESDLDVRVLFVLSGGVKRSFLPKNCKETDVLLVKYSTKVTLYEIDDKVIKKIKVVLK